MESKLNLLSEIWLGLKEMYVRIHYNLRFLRTALMVAVLHRTDQHVGRAY